LASLIKGLIKGLIKRFNSRLARWRIKLAEYNYEIIYKPGKINANTNALSRNLVTIRSNPLKLSVLNV